MNHEPLTISFAQNILEYYIDRVFFRTFMPINNSLGLYNTFNKQASAHITKVECNLIVKVRLLVDVVGVLSIGTK